MALSLVKISTHDNYKKKIQLCFLVICLMKSDKYEIVLVLVTCCLFLLARSQGCPILFSAQSIRTEFFFFSYMMMMIHIMRYSPMLSPRLPSCPSSPKLLTLLCCDRPGWWTPGWPIGVLIELLISSTPPDSGPSKVGDWTAL